MGDIAEYTLVSAVEFECAFVDDPQSYAEVWESRDPLAWVEGSFPCAEGLANDLALWEARLQQSEVLEFMSQWSDK